MVEVTNAGRRPLGLDPVGHLLLADGSEVVATDPRRYHDTPANHRVAEAQGYLVVIPVAAWREGRAACRAAGKHPARCVAVGVVDGRGRRHRARLPRDLAAWLNSRRRHDRLPGSRTAQRALAGPVWPTAIEDECFR